jgi:hypothetical protein
MDNSNRLFDADTAPNIFAHDLARIVKLGANRALIFTVPSCDDRGYQMVQVKLIIPAEYMVTLGMIIASDGSADERNTLALMHTSDIPS